MTKFDKLTIVIFLIFSACTALLIFRGDRTFPTVEYFNHENTTISPERPQLLFRFNREVDSQSVEKAFSITPQTEGKISWIGRKMAFTPSTPLLHNTNYEIKFNIYQDSYGKDSQNQYISNFQTVARSVIYIDGTENFRQLVRFDLEKNSKTVLTQPELQVLDYHIHPNKKQIIFSAVVESELEQDKYLTDIQKLYSVNIETRQIELLANNTKFINGKFEVSPNGQYIALYRIELDSNKNPVNRDVYLLDLTSEQKEWKQFWYKNPLDDIFKFSPDSQSLFAIDEQSFVTIPLKENSEIQYIGTFNQFFDFDTRGNRIVFGEADTENIVDNFNKLIVLEKNGAQETLFESEGTTDQVILSERDPTAYLISKNTVQSNSENYYLYQYTFKDKSLTPIFQPENSNIGKFDLNVNNEIILEKFEESKDYGKRIFERDFQENFEQTLIPADIWYINYKGETVQLPLQGKNPKWLH